MGIFPYIYRVRYRSLLSVLSLVPDWPFRNARSDGSQPNATDLFNALAVANLPWQVVPNKELDAFILSTVPCSFHPQNGHERLALRLTKELVEEQLPLEAEVVSPRPRL